jgi:hypothetical protein
LYESTDTSPSADAHASIGYPTACGAHARAFTACANATNVRHAHISHVLRAHSAGVVERLLAV